MSKKFIFIYILFSIVIHLDGSALVIMPKPDFLEKVILSPAKLSYHRDSIQFDLEGEIPILSLLSPRSPRLFLEFSTQEKKMKLGELNLEKELSAYTYKKSFSIHYEAWMEGAQLELKFFYGKKQILVPNQSKIIARGVITTPLMVKIGQIVADEPIPDVGLYMTEDQVNKDLNRFENVGFSSSFSEMILSGKNASRLDAKESIYLNMTEFFRSPLSFNNLAVVKMQQAQRELNQNRKVELWDQAKILLDQAKGIEPSAYILHNLAQIQILERDYTSAYKNLSDATVMTKEKDFLRINENLRGALDIIRGDYKLATIRFDYEYSGSKSLFNKGLAFMLAEEYGKAIIYFEESIQVDRSFGYGFYGLAWIAAASGQDQLAIEHLSKAIDTSEFLSQKALKDPIFEEVRKYPDFVKMFKKSSD